MPPGPGSQSKPQWFKCPPPPTSATTPWFHLKIGDTNIEDRQLIQRGWLRVPFTEPGFDARVPQGQEKKYIKKKHRLLGSSVCSSSGTETRWSLRGSEADHEWGLFGRLLRSARSYT